jgi:hypothetical protein
MKSTHQEARMSLAQLIEQNPLQSREQRNSQGAVRTYVRYGDRGPWYRGLVEAQAALQRRARWGR